MVSLEDIKKKRKIKLLLKGGSAVGKTFTCIKIAHVALQAGKKVLYLDHERGAIEEIIHYFEVNNITDLQNFEHEDYFEFGDLVNIIKKYSVDSVNKVDLIIIDPLPLTQVCRISATNDIKNQGFYYQGEKVVKLEDMKNITQFTTRINSGDVDNKTTFSLRGWAYSLPNHWELEFKDLLVSMPPDVIVTLLTPDKKNNLDPYFDYVLEMSQVSVSDPVQKVVAGKLETTYVRRKIYKGIPKKIRGESQQIVEEMENPWKAILKPFCRKYSNKECEDK
jgi:hypothetical protein